MKAYNISRYGKFAGCLLLLLWMGASEVLAQTVNDLILAEPRGFKLCNNDVNGEEITVYNQCTHSGFQNGTFQVDWGDGSAVENWGSGETMVHTYLPFGVFDLVFSWRSADGGKSLSKVYQVMRLKKPIVALKEGEAGNTCNNVEAEIKLIDFELQTKGTTYYIDFGDNVRKSFTQKQIVEEYNGIIKHKFETEDCPIRVMMRVENECPGLVYETTFNTAVVVPPKARFEFLGTACTGYPVGVKNISVEGKNVQCQESTDYIWKFGDKPSEFSKDPSVVFDVPGTYEIRLIAWTNGLECSRDTMIKKVTVVESPKVNFNIDRNAVCSGEVVHISDNSLGEDIEYFWEVSGNPITEYLYVNGTHPNSINPAIQLNGYGDYTIKLSLRNNCPDNEDSKIVAVSKNPEVKVHTWTDSLCAPRGSNVLSLDLADYFSILWNGNPESPEWKIEPVGGMTGTVEFEPGYGIDSEYPRVKLEVGNTYLISVALEAVSVEGVECGDPDKRIVTKTLKVKDPNIVSDVTPSVLPGADGVISICDGTELAFTNLSTGENLKHGWTITPFGNYDPNWKAEYLSGDSESPSPVFRFSGYGDFIVTDMLRTDCNSEPVSFKVHLKKNPEVFMTNFPKELCPGDVMNAGMCIFYNWYNNEQKARWEFTPNTVDFLNGTTADSPEPQIHFRTSEKYTYTVTVPNAGCPLKDTVVKGETRVRMAGLNVIVKEKDNFSEVCEGGTLTFLNQASENDPEGTELRYKWEVNVPEEGQPQGGSPADCKFLGNKDDDKVAAITFQAWGTYDVKAVVIGYCDTVYSTLRITVRKNPEVQLNDVAHCPGKLVLASTDSYRWWNSTPSVAWTIRRQDGLDQPGDYEMEADASTQLYPEVDFKRPGRYYVKALLNHAGCPASDPEVEVEYWIYDPELYGDIKLESPAFGDPLTADICEGETVNFENTMTEDAGQLSWLWTVEGGEAGDWQFVDGGTMLDPEEGKLKKSPSFQFFKNGDYRVKVIVFSTCKDAITKEFQVIVRGVPEIVLQPRLEKICADWIVEMKDHLVYADKKNNDLTYEWSVVADRAVDPPLFDVAAEFPVFDFHGENARYTITLKAFSQCAAGGVQELNSKVDVISLNRKSLFEVDSVGCTDFELTLDNRSEGDSLSYLWTVVSEDVSNGGWQYIQGDEQAESPRLKITEAGFYTVSLQVENICGSDVSQFRVKAYSVPEIEIADIADACEPLLFQGKDRITVKENNDSIRQVNWQITERPGSLSEGYEFTNGTTVHSAYPDIIFRACDYEVTVEYRNRCPLPGRKTFQVKVDRFIPIEPIADRTVCVLTDPFPLEAFPAGGSWTLKEAGTPNAGRILYRDGAGNDWFNPEFDPYFEGDIELVYSKANFSCMARDTMKVHVFPLPRVEAGDPLQMCINHEPFPLANGTPQKGDWMLENGTLLAENLFTPDSAGDFKLKYYFTDEHTCRNADSTVMTVYPLPDTRFEVPVLNCIRTGVEVVPKQLDGNRFEWDFGDSSGKVVSEGNQVHTYEDFGYMKISNTTTSRYGCTDRSDSVEIEIVNVPPPAFFKADPLKGCARFGVDPGSENAALEVNFIVDTLSYADNHNYLSFSWEYGDGTGSEKLLPVQPKYYPSGAWDTTYTARFVVSNMCGTEKIERTVTVLSAPKVKFALKHEWECSPVLLELQNTTTGNHVKFDWTFENARTGEIVRRTDVRNPVYEFATDSASTTFYITLKAANSCDEDVFTDSLVVKPRTISAHFTPGKREVCVGEELCFRNNSTDTLSAIVNTYWNFGDETKDTVWSPCHVYQVPRQYVVSLLIDNGCGFHTTDDTITVRALPQLELLSDEQGCEEDMLTFVVHSDQELKFVNWNFGDGRTDHRDSLQHVFDDYGKYTVTVEGISVLQPGCKAIAQKEVEVYNKPNVTITLLDTMHCSPFLYRPEADGEAHFEWDYGDGTQLTTAEEHWYQNLTDTVQKFNVTLYAQTDKGCKSEYAGEVSVYNRPKAAIGKQVVPGRPEKVTFLNQTIGGTDGYWELPFGGTVRSQEDQIQEFRENGIYPVKYIAESYYGCSDTTEIEHIVEMKGLYFPNTFIPQSANGKVNRFNGIAMGLKEYWLEIYDYYGNKIWETRALENGKPSEGWDGRNARGEMMPQGTYIWRARAVFVDDNVWTGKNNDSGVIETVQGSVLMLRE